MNNPAITILIDSRDRAAAELATLFAQVRDLKANIKAYDHAISVLTGAPTITDDSGSGRITLRDMILARVRESSGTTSPRVAAELTNGGRVTGETTVSSIFSRLKGEGLIERREGLWFALNEKAPDGQTSEALDEMGAGDGSRGAPSQPTAAGSIPVASTFANSKPSTFDDDLSVDVPF